MPCFDGAGWIWHTWRSLQLASVLHCFKGAGEGLRIKTPLKVNFSIKCLLGIEKKIPRKWNADLTKIISCKFQSIFLQLCTRKRLIKNCEDLNSGHMRYAHIFPTCVFNKYPQLTNESSLKIFVKTPKMKLTQWIQWNECYIL